MNQTHRKYFKAFLGTSILMCAFFITPFTAKADTVNPPVTTGTLTVCKMIVDQNGVIATSSANLAQGYFGLTVGTSTDIFGNPLFQDQWSAEAFTPNTSLVLHMLPPAPSIPDAQCYTHTLPLGSYYYSQEDIAGNFPVWTQFPVRYYDGVQSGFSIASSSIYSTATLANDVSDGIVTLNTVNPNKIIVLVNGYQSFACPNNADCAHLNHPPVITIVGANPATVTQGTTYTDAGATATDPQDGDITSKIITTGSVATSTVGTYTMTYTVTDNEGLSATANRTVNVVAALTPNTCIAPTAGTDATVTIQPNSEMTLGQILASANLNINPATDQKGYQFWTTTEASTTIQVQYINGVAAAGDVFGYYVKGASTTFVPIFVAGAGSNTLYPNIPVATPGQIFSITLPQGAYGFATNSLFNTVDSYWTSETALNNDGIVHILSYDTPAVSGSYALALEDLPNSISDHDYNDVVVEIHTVGCNNDVTPVNHPPVITLIGDNPLYVRQDTTFTDPGATATDQEDGNITSKIVVTGSVDTHTFGTYILTYSVTDSGGLTASTTRSVGIISADNGGGGNTYCPNGGDMTYAEFVQARNAGLVNISLSASSTTSTAIAHITNTTGCTFPISLASYRVFDQVLSHQVYFSGTGLIDATSTTQVQVHLPSCMAQIDLYFGLSPQTLLDSNPYSGPNPPVVLAATFIYNTGNGYANAAGQFCTNTPPAQPPVITLIGANPFIITVGTTFVDPGATATDPQDGNLTADIIKTGTVGTTTIGTYTLTYSVTDTEGLSASTTRVVDVVAGNGGGGNPNTGTVQVCLVIERYNGTIATSSANLAPGSISLTLASTSLVQTPTWNIPGFTPNRMLITTEKDADCISYTNIPFGTYTYSTTTTTGAAYTGISLYNDGAQTPVTSLFSFFPFSTTTPDADGVITLNSMNTNQTVTVLEIATNTPPTIALVGNNPLNLDTGATFTDPGATASDAEDGDLTSKIIASSTVDTTTPGTYVVTYTVTDSGGLTASTTRSVIVSTPTTGGGCTTDCGGGGGGGNGCSSNCGGGGNGPIVGSLPAPVNGGGNGPIVVSTPATTTTVVGNGGSCYYLYDYLHTGWNNNPVEVKKLQVFLKDLEGYPVVVTGVYDAQTVTYLDAFQVRYGADILVPWDGTYNPSGFTYILTKKKVNEIYCQTAFPLTVQQQQVIDAYRAFINDLNTNGVQIVPPTTEQLNPAPVTTGEIGLAASSSSSSSSSSNLAIGGPTGSTTSILSSKLGEAAAAILAFPWNWMKGIVSPKDCVLGNALWCKWIDVVIGVIILILIYLLFRGPRQPQETQDVSEVNKELDLK